jgi:hypothetical protein
MWKLGLTKGGVVREFLQVPAEETTFFAVLRRGPTVSTKCKTYVRAEHLAMTGDKYLVFPMALLESTEMEEFGNGVMGLWKLYEHKKEVRVSLMEEYTDAKKFLVEAKSDQNPEWIRASYSSLDTH